jgi:hypothetical protein
MVGERPAMTNGVEKSELTPLYMIDNFFNENLIIVPYNIMVP